MTYNPETPVFLANCYSLVLTMRLIGNIRKKLYTKGPAQFLR
jgi:hypothetical protein